MLLFLGVCNFFGRVLIDEVTEPSTIKEGPSIFQDFIWAIIKDLRYKKLKHKVNFSMLSKVTLVFHSEF